MHDDQAVATAIIYARATRPCGAKKGATALIIIIRHNHGVSACFILVFFFMILLFIPNGLASTEVNRSASCLLCFTISCIPRLGFLHLRCRSHGRGTYSLLRKATNKKKKADRKWIELPQTFRNHTIIVPPKCYSSLVGCDGRMSGIDTRTPARLSTGLANVTCASAIIQSPMLFSL